MARRHGGTRRLAADRTAIAAVEFALMTPVLLILSAAVIDMGSLLSLRLQLETAVTAATDYAVVNNADVSSANGAALATNLAQIVGANVSGTISAGSIIVNNGPSETIANGTATAGGVASNADSLYCPSGTAAPWTWGSAVAAGTNCSAGGTAGKFVTVSVSAKFTPVFSTYGFIRNNTLTVSAIMQAQ